MGYEVGDSLERIHVSDDLVNEIPAPEGRINVTLEL